MLKDDKNAVFLHYTCTYSNISLTVWLTPACKHLQMSSANFTEQVQQARLRRQWMSEELMVCQWHSQSTFLNCQRIANSINCFACTHVVQSNKSCTQAGLKLIVTTATIRINTVHVLCAQMFASQRSINFGNMISL